MPRGCSRLFKRVAQDINLLWYTHFCEDPHMAIAAGVEIGLLVRSFDLLPLPSFLVSFCTYSLTAMRVKQKPAFESLFRLVDLNEDLITAFSVTVFAKGNSSCCWARLKWDFVLPLLLCSA